LRGDSGSPQRTRLRSHVCEPKSIFSDAHVIGKNALNFLCACGRKLCEAFCIFQLNRFGGKSCFMHRTRYSQFVFRNNTVCSGKQRGFPVIYRQSDEARQTKTPIISFPLIFSPFLGDRPARSRSSLPAANRMAKAERRYTSFRFWRYWRW